MKNVPYIVVLTLCISSFCSGHLKAHDALCYDTAPVKLYIETLEDRFDLSATAEHANDVAQAYLISAFAERMFIGPAKFSDVYDPDFCFSQIYHKMFKGSIVPFKICIPECNIPSDKMSSVAEFERLDRKDLEIAIRYFTKTNKLRKNVKYQIRKAWSLHVLGKTDEAEKLYRSVINESIIRDLKDKTVVEEIRPDNNRNIYRSNDSMLDLNLATFFKSYEAYFYLRQILGENDEYLKNIRSQIDRVGINYYGIRKVD